MSHDGKLFLAAFDHPQIYGAMHGLENPYTTIAKVMEAFSILSRGEAFKIVLKP